MKIQDFILKYPFNDRDTFCLIKMYSEIEKTEKEWIKLLEKDFTFSIKEVAQEIEINTKNKK